MALSKHWTPYIALFIIGCELFTTREVELPGAGSGGEWEFPQTPRIVLANFANAIGTRSVVDYMRGFTSDPIGSAFEFIADPDAAATYQGVFDDWGIDRERQHVELLLSESNLPLMSLAELSYVINRETLLGDTANLSTDYELHLEHTRQGAPQEMQGRMELRLERGSDGGWYIHRWSDFRDAGSACWSDLKVKF